MRKGMMIGKGSGYKNVIAKDPKVHSDSARGMKQPQRLVPTEYIFDPKKSRVYNKTGMTNEDYNKLVHSSEPLKDYDDYLKKSREKREMYKPSAEEKRILKETDKQNFGEYKIGELRKTFSKYQNKEGWKKPFTAIVDTPQEAEKLRVAINFFLADEPIIERIVVPVRHKEGLVFMEAPAYRVITRGYQAW